MGQSVIGVGQLPTDLAAMFLNFSTVYQDVFDSTPSFADQFIMEVPFTTRALMIGWADKIPQVREWLGPRVIQNMNVHKQTVLANKYEVTMGIPEEDIEDDQVGLYVPQAKLIAEAMKRFPEKMLTKLIESNPNTYDGQPFYSDAHPIDTTGAIPGTQSNIVDAALSQQSLEDAIALLGSLKGSDGSPLGLDLSQLTLMVPNQLRGLGMRLLNAEFYPELRAGASLGNGDVGTLSNIWKGAAKLVVNPWLTDQTAAYLFYTGSALRPFMHGTRRAPRFVAKTNPSDENVFWNGQFIMGADRRDAFANTLYQLAVKIKDV